MRYLIATILIPLALLAQVQNIPNTTFPAVRSMMNANFGWLNTNKAGVSACPANQYAIQTTTAGVVCASLTSGQLTTALGFTPAPVDSPTFTGTVTMETALPKKLGAAVFFADQFAGADASIKINACVTAVIAAGGGTCDARALGGVQAMSQQINVGSAVQAAGAVSVALLLPTNGTWTWGLTDGTSCGLYQYSGTSIIGAATGGGGNPMKLSPASSSTSMDSLYCTDSEPPGATAGSKGGSYVRAEGFAAVDTVGATWRDGLIHIRYLWDESGIRNVTGVNYYGDVWHIDSACCGATLEHIHAFSNVSTGGLPIKVGRGAVILGASVTSGSPTVTSSGFVLSPAYVGMQAIGTNIPGATIVTAVSSTTLTLSANATGTGTITLQLRPNANIFVGTTNGSPTLTGTNFTANWNGMSLTGTGIPANTKVLSVNSPTSLTMTNNATADGTNISTFVLPNASINSLAIKDSTFNSPRAGVPNILVVGKQWTNNVSFHNPYMEDAGGDATTPWIYVDDTVSNIWFYAPQANGSGATKYAIENHTADAWGVFGLLTGSGINDVANGRVVAVPSGASGITSYTPDWPTMIWSPTAPMGAQYGPTQASTAWHPERTITVTRLEFWATGALNCTTYPVLQVYDPDAGAAVASVTLSASGPWDSGAVTGDVPAGHTLYLRWGNTAACSSYPNSTATATVQYRQKIR